MREELAGFHKISIYGTRQETDHAKLWLVTLSLTENEATDRMLIQDCIDAHNLRASILYNGNNVYSYKRIIQDMKYILKNGMKGLSHRLYEFFHLCCGSIAHYDIYGWINEYPTIQDVRQFLIKNEYGKDVLSSIPGRKTDVKRIIQDTFILFDIKDDELNQRSITNW